MSWEEKMTEELRLWSIGDSGAVEPLAPLEQMPTEMELPRFGGQAGAFAGG